MREVPEEDRLLNPGEALAVLRVHPNTLIRMGDRGDLTVFRTAGRHRRYRESEVTALRRKREARKRR